MAERVLVSVPRDTVNDESVLILNWKVESGSTVEKDQLICEVETSKAVLEIHAPEAGQIDYRHAAGDEVAVGATICSIGPPGASEPAPAARLTASARSAAEEYGIDISSFAPGTVVRREDILRRVGKPAAGGETAFARGVPVNWTDLPRRKVLEGGILRQGRESSVQSSATSICRAARLDTIIFEAARLLQKYPVFNALHDHGRIGQYGQINVGWALDGGQGLVVPVIAEADKKSIHEIAAIIEAHTEAYLEDRLSPADFLGGTFTVSDLSGLGVSYFQPLIAPGQSAILGIGKGPGYHGETILYLTLAFDHQLAEGRKAAEFLRDLGERLDIHASIEQPERYCVLCQRDSATLQRLKLVLLKSEVPPGFVCSLCLGGW